jgi:hypothetical protein
MLYWTAIALACMLVLLGCWRMFEAWMLSRFVTAMVLGGEQKALGKAIWTRLTKRWQNMVKKEIPKLNRDQEIAVIRDSITRLMLGAVLLFAGASFIVSLTNFVLSRN